MIIDYVCIDENRPEKDFSTFDNYETNLKLLIFDGISNW